MRRTAGRFGLSVLTDGEPRLGRSANEAAGGLPVSLGVQQRAHRASFSHEIPGDPR
jgi:hypothetical protein